MHTEFRPYTSWLAKTTNGTGTMLNAAVKAAVAFAFLAGTGGVTDAAYLIKRHERGYRFACIDEIPAEAAPAPRTAAENLSRIREVLKPAVSDLATLFGVSRQAIYNWQAGEQPSPENAARLEDLASAADLIAAEGLSAPPQLLKRKLANGKSLFETVRDGGSALDGARFLLQLIRREMEQRKALAVRLAGRKAADRGHADYGSPMLDEHT